MFVPGESGRKLEKSVQETCNIDGKQERRDRKRRWKLFIPSITNGVVDGFYYGAFMLWREDKMRKVSDFRYTEHEGNVVLRFGSFIHWQIYSH